mmetsp:Transcript_19273/g.28707  ORF Transcript_19273/g.28707 Transcript_19273/m.28707 type:complete len:236 (+) Transcript_19273:53-760(+)
MSSSNNNTTLIDTKKKELIEYVEQIKSLWSSQSSPWSLVSEKRGVQVYERAHQPSGIPICCGVGVIEGSTFEKVVDLCWDVSKRGEWDLTYGKGKKLECTDEKSKDTVYAHFMTQSGTMVSARDFVIEGHKEVTFTKEAKMVAVSMDELSPRYHKVQKDLMDTTDENPVRGSVLFSGFYLEKLESDDANKVRVRVWYFFQVDAAGWIPGYFNTKVNQFQCYGILGMRKILTGSYE